MRCAEHFSDLFVNIEWIDYLVEAGEKLNMVYLWVAIILIDNQLPFLVSKLTTRGGICALREPLRRKS